MSKIYLSFYFFQIYFRFFFSFSGKVVQVVFPGRRCYVITSGLKAGLRGEGRKTEGKEESFGYG